MIIVYGKSLDGSGVYSSDEDSSSTGGLAVGHYREYHKPSNRSGQSMEKKDLLFDLNGLSAEDNKHIHDLMAQKIFSLQDLSPSQQRRLRNAFNENRKEGDPEIHYDDINPNKDSYSPEYEQRLLAYHNRLLDHQIYNKIYEQEYQKAQELPEEVLFTQIEKIPQDKKSELIQSLSLHTSDISLQKIETQKKIIAAFNTDARKIH